MNELAMRLGRVKHFRGLPEPALQAIVDGGKIKRFAAGSTIFMEGDACAGMFVLLSGRVHLCKIGPQGQRQIIAIIEPVIMFNEVATLDGGPNPVMAIAVTDCLTWVIDCESFHTLMAQYPQMGLGLLYVLATRQRVLMARFEDLSYRSVLARTAKLVLEISSFGQREIDRRQHSVDEIAARIGTGREPVSRALRTLRDSGIIKSTRSSIIVSDPAALAVQARIDVLEE